jgi:DNA-binding MarR family transcriptional regulator
LTDRASQRAYESEGGISLSEGRCLAAIGSFSPLSVKDLAAKANLDKGQASRAAQALFEQELVDKGLSPTDGRGVVLTLTNKGDRTWKTVVAMIERRNEQIVACLDATARRQFDSLLDSLIEHAREVVDDPLTRTAGPAKRDPSAQTERQPAHAI